MHISRLSSYAGRLLLVVFLSASQAHLAKADDTDLARVQAQLYSGKLTEARKAAEAWAQGQPANQTAKFAVASTGFFQAVEKLGQDFHKYGLRSVWTDPSGGMSGVPFLRLPVPQNLNPERASYEAIRTVLSEFNSRLQTVDAELSGIELNDLIDYPLDLKQVRLDFKGGGSQEGLEPLWLVFQRITAMRPPEGESPNLIVNFDAADVVWLRGYTHLLSAITDFLLAHDWHKGFETALHNIFPRSNPEFLRLLTKQKSRADFELGGNRGSRCVRASGKLARRGTGAHALLLAASGNHGCLEPEELGANPGRNRRPQRMGSRAAPNCRAGRAAGSGRACEGLAWLSG